jgi:hypothetical protein
MQDAGTQGPVTGFYSNQTGGSHGFWTGRVAVAVGRSIADHHPVGTVLASLTFAGDDKLREVADLGRQVAHLCCR